MHIYYLFNVQFRWLFLQIFPSAIVSSLRMTLFKSLEGQKQQKQHSQARSRKRGACEVGNCFNIQIPGWGFPPVPSQLFYHSQAFELFTFWCSDVLVLETGISQSLWLQPDGQDSLKFQPHKVSFFFIFLWFLMISKKCFSISVLPIWIWIFCFPFLIIFPSATILTHSQHYYFQNSFFSQ